MTLQEKLDAFKTQFESGGKPYNTPRAIIETMHRATAELIASGQAERAKKAGDVAPTFTLADCEGRTISSNELLVKGPLVLTFYRGVWCPYCNMDLQALEAARSKIEATGATLAALSMQNAASNRKAVQQSRLGFPILVDRHGDVANAFGIRFQLPPYLIDLYKNVFKTNLESYNDDTSWTLPMPARYVIGSDGVIVYAEVNPDYTRRPDPSELMPILTRLARGANLQLPTKSAARGRAGKS